MCPVLITHATARRNRLSIRMRGLLARSTHEHNYPGYRSQPVGVFGRWFGDREWWGWSGSDECTDVYIVDIAGMPTTKDQILESAVVIPQTIPPNRILGRLTRDELPIHSPIPKKADGTNGAMFDSIVLDFTQTYAPGEFAKLLGTETKEIFA